jgi:NAD(P)-dependent dehydrogenase (short-subunit alcohol dehydrogenase family)
MSFAEIPPRTADPPKQWGFTDEQLATLPLAFRSDLFAGQTVLISGGGSGIGRALAYVFVRLGANVMVCGRRLERLEETADGIRRLLGREVACHAMTIRDPEQVERLVAATWERFGALDHLVNNGGGQFPQAAIDFSPKGWNAVIDTNLNGTWYMMQAAARQWRDRGRSGSIVNIVAVVNRGIPQLAHTCAARAGVVYLTKTVSVEWAPLGIRVNCLAPGPTATDGLNVYPRAAAEALRDSTPLKRFGTVLDVAHGVAYLASPDTGGFVTGEVLSVDGGRQQWGEDWPGGMPDYFRTPGR